MDTITLLTEDLEKGLVLLKKLIRSSSIGFTNFKEVTSTLQIIDKLLYRISDITDNDEEDYSLSITLDDSEPYL